MSLKKFLLIIFSIGFIFVSLGDMNHVFTNTTWYNPDVFKLITIYNIPLWVAIQFGFASVVFTLAYMLIRNIFVYEKKSSLIELNIFSTVFLLGYLASGWIGSEYGYQKDLSFYGLVMLSSYKYFDIKEHWPELVFVLGVMVVGCTYEMTLVKLGIFGYHAPQNTLCGVANWLPALYFFAAKAIVEMVEVFES
jgi:hypothetical protein